MRLVTFLYDHRRALLDRAGVDGRPYTKTAVKLYSPAESLHEDRCRALLDRAGVDGRPYTKRL